MNVAVRVGRPVVEDEFRLAVTFLPQLLVEPDLVPVREQLRLLLRQAGAHGKVGLRQKQRLGIVGSVGRGVGHGGLFSRGIRGLKALMSHRLGGPA